MNNQEITDIIAKLDRAGYDYEQALLDNGGEVTEEVEHLSVEINDLKELLAGEGIDSLGRWLKSREDRLAALKAEKDYVSRKINAEKDYIDFIKSRINDVMKAIGETFIKGELGYSFKAFESSTISVNKEYLNARYMEEAERAIREAGVPEYIGVTLTASSKAAEAAGINIAESGLFLTTKEDTVRFSKPRASKDSKE